MTRPTISDLVPDPLFRGNPEQLVNFLAGRTETHCVYILCAPDGVPFYVGEGLLTRPVSHISEARHAHRIIESNRRKCDKIRKIEAAGGEVEILIDMFSEDKIEVVQREGDLIKQLGRREEQGPLLNYVPGYGNPAIRSPEVAARHAASLSGDSDHPETAALNAFFQTLWPVKSTPIKPLMKWKRNARFTTGETKRNELRERPAAAIVAALHSEGLTLEAGTVFPRTFSCCDIPAIIENGVSEDLCGLEHVELIAAEDPLDEAYRINPGTPEKVFQLLGRESLEDLGVLP